MLIQILKVPIITLESGWKVENEITAQFALLAAIGTAGFLGWTYKDQLPYFGNDVVAQDSAAKEVGAQQL